MTRRVLVVDDSLTVRMDLVDALKRAGLDADPAATLDEARRRLAAGRYDAVVLDVMLPDGDGFEFLGELRKTPATAALPTLMLTSEAEARDRLRGFGKGADDFVGKPYDAGYVAARVRELAAAGEELSPFGRPAVLVVEDSPTFRAEMVRVLDGAGYRTVEAGSGEEGLALAAGERLAAAIVDGVLPGIDGAETIRRIRRDAALRALPCLILTASGETVDEVRALESGADAYLRKESGAEAVLPRLAALLRGSAPPEAPPVRSLHSRRRLLLAGRDGAALEEVAAKLAPDGYDLALARGPEEAANLVGVQPPDAVLLLDAEDGADGCARFRAADGGRDLPLLLLAKDGDAAAATRALEAGADDVLPLDAGAPLLRARTAARLRRSQRADERREAEA
ncbi:MAG TPA: response regulator, partial [Planctomycetota bacterium]|nr:response regulator [Planctomycetota bacterium]